MTAFEQAQRAIVVRLRAGDQDVLTVLTAAFKLALDRDPCIFTTPGEAHAETADTLADAVFEVLLGADEPELDVPVPVYPATPFRVAVAQEEDRLRGRGLAGAQSRDAWVDRMMLILGQSLDLTGSRWQAHMVRTAALAELAVADEAARAAALAAPVAEAGSAP